MQILGKSALMHTARLMNSLAKGLKRMGQKCSGYVEITCRLGCVFQDMEPPKSSSILQKSSSTRKPIRFIKIHKALLRRADIREKKTIAWNENVEDRSQEETERQERCACEAAWRLANKKILKNSKRNVKQHSSHLRKIGAYLHQLFNLRDENLLWTPERRCT